LKFQCCGCGFAFEAEPQPSTYQRGPIGANGDGTGPPAMFRTWGGTECLRCGSIYIKQRAEEVAT
jgi:hypothetical protein